MKRILAILLLCAGVTGYGQDEPQCDCPLGINIDGFDFVGNSGESSYYYYNQPVPWTEAQALSQAVGGHIISISSETEQLFLDSVILSNYIDPHWIGLFQNVLSDDYVEPNGGWEWVTGEPLDYVNWIDGEPNEATPGENYGSHHAYSSDYGWNDGHNADVPLVGTPWRFVMEKTCCSFYGCTDTLACNYNPMVFIEDGSCYSCDIPASHCGEGTTWDESSQTCIVSNVSDTDFDGCVGINDFLVHLSNFGSGCGPEPAWACGDPLEYQGYDYDTVQIGEQCWFAENLRAENYRNGEPLLTALESEPWSSTLEGATSIYGETTPCLEDAPVFNACDPSLSLEEYGRLYNWYAVNDSRLLCPQSWEVPSQFDWTILATSLGGLDVAGHAMKASYGWYDSGHGTDVAGFHGKPGGQRQTNGASFVNAGISGYWWSSNFYGEDDGFSTFVGQNGVLVYLGNTSQELAISDASPSSGRSVRCVKD